MSPMLESIRRSPKALLTAALLSACTPEANAAADPDWQTLTSARQIQGEDELDAEVEYAAGQLNIGAAEEGILYHLDLRYDAERFTPVTEYDRDENSLRVGVDSRGDGFSIRDLPDEARATLALAPGIPTDLDLEFGAGRAELELGGLSLQSVDIATGASETRIDFDKPNRIAAEHVRIEAGAASLEARGLGNARASQIEFSGGVGETVLDFSGEWVRDATVSAELGIGSLTLRLPREVGVRLTRESVLTAFDAAGLIERGGVYYSRNWDDARHQVTIDIEAAMGSINIEWID